MEYILVITDVFHCTNTYLTFLSASYILVELSTKFCIVNE